MRKVSTRLEMIAEYRMQHRPADPSYGAPFHDLTHDEFYPEDVYSDKGIQYFGTRFDDQFVHGLLIAARGNPNYPVKIYRTIPANVDPVINPGDWVTPSKVYAQHMVESWQPGGSEGAQVVEMTVPAKDLWGDANSWDEWGYWPS